MAMILTLSCSNGSNTSAITKEEIDKTKESLKLEAKVADKLLAGKEIDFMTKALSAQFDGTNMVYTYEIDEDYATIDQLRDLKKEELKNFLKTNLDNSPEFAETKENLIKINGKVIYNYIGNTSKKVLTITIDL